MTVPSFRSLRSCKAYTKACGKRTFAPYTAPLRAALTSVRSGFRSGFSAIASSLSYIRESVSLCSCSHCRQLPALTIMESMAYPWMTSAAIIWPLAQPVSMSRASAIMSLSRESSSKTTSKMADYSRQSMTGKTIWILSRPPANPPGLGMWWSSAFRRRHWPRDFAPIFFFFFFFHTLTTFRPEADILTFPEPIDICDDLILRFNTILKHYCRQIPANYLYIANIYIYIPLCGRAVSQCRRLHRTGSK